MANLVIKNKNANNSSLTFDINSGSDWKIENNAGTLKIKANNADQLTIHDNKALSMNRKANTTIGNYSMAEGYETSAIAMASHAEGSTTTAEGERSHAEGYQSIAKGNQSHAEGNTTTSEGINSHSEGYNAIAKGDNSHAEGNTTTSEGNQSHAEGNQTIAKGTNSHAEGNQTIAQGSNSHTEGFKTEALNNNTHAEGNQTIAKGSGSHAEGSNTIASGSYQHVQGKYNIEDTENKYAHIVGNGDDTTCSNAHTLDWNGNAWFAGNISTVKEKGYFLVDKKEFSYPGVYDNGTNLWIGSTASATTHHTGNTYISSGHNGKTDDTAAGYKSIYIAIPNAENTSSTNKLIFHQGYLDVGCATDGILAIKHGGTGKSAWKENRMVWVTATGDLQGGNHWVDETHVGINMLEAPTTALGVNGSTRSFGNISAYSNSATEISVYAQNSTGKVSLVVQTDGDRGLYDSTGSAFKYYYSKANERWQLGTSYVTGTLYIANSTYWPGIQFTSSNKDEERAGVINYAMRTSNTATSYGANCFYFSQYSYTDNSLTRLAFKERFKLPNTGPGLDADKDYSILTTKNTITVAQGGTGATTHTANAVLTGNGTSAIKNVATASGAFYATAANGAAKFGTLPIAQGGTGATTAAGARQNINYIGANPIKTTTDDTPTKWGDQGIGVAYYNTDDQITDQPTAVGFLLNQVTGGVMAAHLWTAINGRVYARGCASDGSSFGDWYRLLSTKDTVTVAQGGTGATSFTSGQALIGAGTGAITTRAITNNTSISHAGWSSGVGTNLITLNTLAYWNGQYADGKSNLTKLGTVTSGTWNASTIGIGYGGTGGTTWQAATYNLLKGTVESTDDITDSSQFAFIYASPTSSKGSLYFRKGPKIWSYIQGKSDDRYLKLTGGTLSGTLTVNEGADAASIVRCSDGTNKISLQVSGSDNKGIYDDNNGQWMIYRPDGTTIASKTTRMQGGVAFTGAHGTGEPGSSTPGYGVTGAVYFRHS